MKTWFFSIVLIAANFCCHTSEAAMQLIDRLKHAEEGDYIVTAIDNTYTALIISKKTDRDMSIDEITIPLARVQTSARSWSGWKHWIKSGAPDNTSHIVYTVDTGTGKLTRFFPYTKNAACDIATAEHFLSKLLTLKMTRLAKKDTKRVGPAPPQGNKDARKLWSPQMTYEGKIIPDVAFEAWRTHWPKDSSELSDKIITVYVPKDDTRYPSYFPYWLEIQGLVGKAKVRIIDSGRLKS